MFKNLSKIRLTTKNKQLFIYGMPIHKLILKQACKADRSWHPIGIFQHCRLTIGLRSVRSTARFCAATASNTHEMPSNFLLPWWLIYSVKNPEIPCSALSGSAPGTAL